MVIFEILASHYHMLTWHEERIDQHTRDMEALHSAGSGLRLRIDALLQQQAASPSAARRGKLRGLSRKQGVVCGCSVKCNGDVSFMVVGLLTTSAICFKRSHQIGVHCMLRVIVTPSEWMQVLS